MKVYVQYSYGGYKLYRLDDIKEERVDTNVATPQDRRGFPKELEVYYNWGGLKLIYRTLPNGELGLVIKQMKCNDKDSSGRALRIAVFFVGDEAERLEMNNIALRITDDICEFEKFFADLFYYQKDENDENDGLFFRREQFDQYLAQQSKQKYTSSHTIIDNLRRRRDGILLFVASSELFGKDKTTTKLVCKDLKMDFAEVEGAYLTEEQFMQMQRGLTRTTEVQTGSVHEGKTEKVYPAVNTGKERPLPFDLSDKRNIIMCVALCIIILLQIITLYRVLKLS